MSDTTPRDQLAKLVLNRDEWDAADAILAAGWRPPLTAPDPTIHANPEVETLARIIAVADSPLYLDLFAAGEVWDAGWRPPARTVTTVEEPAAAHHAEPNADGPTDAEVRAAARAVFETRDDPYDDTEWGELTSADRERWECYARAALVAARTVRS